MAKKRGRKTGAEGARDVLTSLRSTRAWRDWLERYAAGRGISVTEVIAEALAADSQLRGYPGPPNR